MKLKKWYALIILLCMVFSLMGLYIYCGTQFNSSLYGKIHDTMNTIALEYTGVLYRYMDKQKEAMWRISAMLNAENCIEANGEVLMEELHSQLRLEPFSYLGILLLDGNMYGSDGTVHAMKHSEEIWNSMNGDVATSCTNISYSGRSNILYQTCPVYHNQEIIAVLYGEFPAEQLHQLSNDQNFSGNGTYALIHENGNFIMKPKWADKGNFLRYLEDVRLDDEMSVQKLQDMMDASASGKFLYEENGARYYCDYRPIAIDDWYLISRVNEDYMQAEHEYFYSLGLTFGVGTAIILLLGSGIYIFIQWKKMNGFRQRENDLQAMTKNIRGGIFHFKLDEKAQLGYISDGFLTFMGYGEKELREKCDNCFFNIVYPEDRDSIHRLVERQESVENYEFRMEQKDGNIVWIYSQGVVVEKNHEKWMYVTALDITQNKLAQEELKVSEECFHLIMEKTDSIIFQWDIPRDTVTVTDVWEKKLGYPIVENGGFLHRAVADLTYPDDLPKHRKLFHAIQGGKHYGEEIVRIRRADNAYIWCRICLSAMSYHNQMPQRAVGVVIDIDREKREMEEMQAMAERDSLSTLYNKGTTKQLISNFLAQEGRNSQHAFVMLDIDDFKNINDSLGHMYGDAAIADVSSTLKSVFRSSDILGRIGGDEFVVFVKDISSYDMIVEKAGELCRMMQGIYAGQNKEIQLSASIGVALFYEDGVSYDQLYRAADLALYRSKRAGKNQYAFYDKTIDEDPNNPESAIYERIRHEHSGR